MLFCDAGGVCVKSYRRLAKAPGSVPMSTTHLGGLHHQMTRHAAPLAGCVPRTATSLHVALSLALQLDLDLVPAAHTDRGKPPSRNPPIFPVSEPSGCRRARSSQASGRERLPSSTVIMSARHLVLATVFVLLALAAVESAKPKRKQVLHMRRGGPSRAAGRGAADARQSSVLLSLPALR